MRNSVDDKSAPQPKASKMDATSADSSVTSRVFRGSSYLLVQKLLTFILNTFVLRKLRPEVTGAATIQLELVLATTFLFRDGFRLAYLRLPSLELCSEWNNKKLQTYVNFAWLSTLSSWLFSLSLLIYVLVSPNLATSYADQQSIDLVHSKSIIEYRAVFSMYCVAAMIEALGEILYLFAHCSLFVSWQVSAQGFGFVCKTLLQYIGVFVFDSGLYAYGWAEIGYSLALVLFLGFCYHRKMGLAASKKPFALTSWKQLLPRRKILDSLSDDKAFIDRLYPLCVQSATKYLLTEGDKWILSCFATFEMMGIYGIVSNWGSLVPRLMFLPLEEAIRAIISKSIIGHVASKNNRRIPRDTLKVFWNLMRFMNIIGLLFACFGFPYTKTLLLLLLGSDKAQDNISNVLSVYCIYIWVLGVNGISEAFVHSIAVPNEFMAFNRSMVAFFVLYAIVAYILMSHFHLGSIGLILANCVNMVCRIAYCFSFISRLLEEKPKRFEAYHLFCHTLPGRLVLLALLSSVGFTFCSYVQLILPLSIESSNKMLWNQHGKHLLLGMMCFLGVGLCIIQQEKRVMSEVFIPILVRKIPLLKRKSPAHSE
uniref:Protein RFT1 homolog n=1 Tax=Albugo laibachii Nc14 TaxID=890382 RepID=F0WDI9_9STRA|nr:conserved hypothetical protein [Albugo laibachii Nc14]|eukprot:CCA19263.1 conserved hypothetical protein [Albugo laibachii Nc14]